MTKLAVIADDITGANDTAVQFAKHRISTCVRINFDQEKLLKETADVIVVDTDSRDMASTAAYEKVKQVCETLQHSGVKQFYKKVDSTLRGNLGAEIEATASVVQPELVVIAPAFPSNHRVTVGGYHLLHQIPIELTEIAYAPKSPVKESRIVELLRQQTEQKIGHVTLTEVIAGVDTLTAAIQDCVSQGKHWIVFDAVLDEHLETIVKSAQKYEKVLWVGSAGLAEQLPKFYQWSSKTELKSLPVYGPVLIVAGSVSKSTQAQIRAVLRQRNIQLVKMNVEDILRNQEAEVSWCTEEAKKFLGQGKDVLLASALTDEDVQKAVCVGEKFGYSSTEVSEETAQALAQIVAELTECSLAGLVLTGGDTAIHVCRALGAEAIQIQKEVANGIPLGKLVGGRCCGLNVVTKAGAFGQEDAFVSALQAIRKEPY